MPDPSLVTETWRSLGPRLASVFHAAVTPYALVSLDHEFIEVNEAYMDMTERSREECLGRHILDVFPPNPDLADDTSSSLLIQSFERVAESGVADLMPVLRFDVADEDGEFESRSWHVTNIPITDHAGAVEMVLVHAEEVTAYVRRDVAEHTDSPSQATAVADVFTAEIARLENLNGFALALVGASTPKEVGRAVCRDGMALAGAVGASLVLLDSDMFSTVASTGIEPTTVDRWSRFANDVGNEPFADAIASGEALFFESRSAFLDSYPTLAAEVEAHPTHQAWVVLPLQLGDRNPGAIGLIYDTPQTFPTALRLVLYTLANLTAQAAARAQLSEEQGAAVKSVRDTLNPQVDDVPGLSLSHCYRPATVATAAGGDWYDVVRLTDTVTLIAIGDVANHGVAAIGEMSRVRATVHSFASADLEPAAIATWTDQILTRFASTHTTGVIATIEHETMVLTWTCAGHPYPIIVDQAGRSTVLNHTDGAPLGTGFTERYGQQERQLEPGDRWVLYTDGLVERPGELVTESIDRLAVLLGDRWSPEELAERICDEMFPGGQHRDDIAFLAVTVDD